MMEQSSRIERNVVPQLTGMVQMLPNWNIIIFSLTSLYMLVCVGRLLEMDFQVILSFTRSLLTPFCLRSILIPFSHVFFGLPVPVVPVTLIVLHLLVQAFLSILSTWLNQRSLLFCIQLPILSNLFLSSLELSLSFTLTLHIHLIILMSFRSMWLWHIIAKH